MRVDALTHKGAVRSSNQDSCAYGMFSHDSAWAVVCDGMGGANGGNVASSVACQSIQEFIVQGFDENLSSVNLKKMMLEAMEKANADVHRKAQGDEELTGMGTTAVILIATKGMLHVAHVGDSRAYLKNQQGVSQITVDHSYVQDLVNFGQITQEEARVHPQRNIITRVLGVHPTVECDYSQVDFAPGTSAIACSDGLSNYLDEDILLDHMNQCEHHIEQLVKRLIDFANNCGGSDNITVAVIQND